MKIVEDSPERLHVAEGFDWMKLVIGVVMLALPFCTLAFTLGTSRWEHGAVEGLRRGEAVTLTSERAIVIHDPDHIDVVGNQVIVDLRRGALRNLYETKLNDASRVPIPVLGHLRAVDILRITGARTGDHTLLVDARFNFVED